MANIARCSRVERADMHVPTHTLVAHACAQQQLQGLLKLSSFQFLNTSFGVDGYTGRPSFLDPEVNVHEVVRYGCPGFATKISALHWQRASHVCLGRGLHGVCSCDLIW